MKLTIEPTGEYFMHVGIPMQRWRGATESGTPVNVLVATVSTAPGETIANVIGLVPLPPPSTGWTDLRRHQMTRLWQLGDRITERQAHELAMLAEGWIADAARGPV